MRFCLIFVSLLFFVTVTNARSQTAPAQERLDRGIDRESVIKFPDSCTQYEFKIDSLPYGELSNTAYSQKVLDDRTGTFDADFILMSVIRGELHYHPVSMCHRAFHIVAAYRTTGDSAYLELAKRYVSRLVKESHEFDGAIYYTYTFDHKVHHVPRALLTAPWYSGMAQGEILGLMVRMFWATGDSLYIDYAQKTFKSFLRPRGEFEPWTVFVDSLGCYWIEEYPTEEPSMTLNGFIYGLYGVYDYYLLTGDEQVRKVLTDCLSTLKNYLPSYRRPGKATFYDLEYQYWSEPYHRVHVKQLRHLYKITKDEFFNEWADIFESDFN